MAGVGSRRSGTAAWISFHQKAVIVKQQFVALDRFVVIGKCFASRYCIAVFIAATRTFGGRR